MSNVVQTKVVEMSSSRSPPQGETFEPVFRILCLTSATVLLASLGGVLISLLIGGWPAFARFGLGFFTTATWDPVREIYGAAGPIVGTLITSTMALMISLPVAGAVAFFLVELCPPILRRPIGTAVELLAGIPSIVYGMWGLFVFAPFFSQTVELPLMSAARPGSMLEALTQGVPNGSGIVAAAPTGLERPCARW
jgi:phosphate transport system permease protein